MTGFPHSLKESKDINVNFRRIMQVGMLKRALDKCFTELRIGEAYQNLGFNMYSYEYINKMRIIDGIKREKLIEIHPKA